MTCHRCLVDPVPQQVQDVNVVTEESEVSASVTVDVVTVTGVTSKFDVPTSVTLLDVGVMRM